jgi:MFS family permease
MSISSSEPSSKPNFSRPRGLLAAFAFPQFRRVWLASVVFSLGNWGERLATGWVVLKETDDVFLAAATFAVRQAPQLILAPIGGAVADRFSRGKIMLAVGIYKGLVLGSLALVAANDLEPLWLVFVILAFSGVGHSFELPSVQGMVTGSVPRDIRMNAVAVQSTGMRAVGALGALAAGFAINALGVPITFVVSGMMFVVGGLLALIADRGLRIKVVTKSESMVRDVIDGLKLMSTLPIVRMILITAVMVEIFGFAYGAVMPAVAQNALNVDAEGLGTLTMMAGFVAALVLIMGVGASAAAFDAMQWTLLQLNVPDDMRGRAVGAWVFAIGFGWIGHLGMGAVGEAVGVQATLAGAGIIVIATGVLVLLFSPLIRKI